MKEKTKNQSIIDTSTMSEGQRAALEMAEGSRDKREISGFSGALFMGVPDFSKLSPFPSQSLADKNEGDTYITKLKDFLDNETDPDQIDKDGEIPDVVIDGLVKLGTFGIKIPKKYGGLGLSQTNYSRTAMVLGAHCGSMTALVSAHQSIGVPQPLLVFGTDKQKEHYLPSFAKGGISAFALTENNVGSDPAKMATTATKTEDGDYLINGEKLWCTNGLKASHIVVMAKTPTETKPYATTAFIVATDSAGVEIVTRCHFMGLKALYNGVIRFTNVKVTSDHIVAAEGKGLKVALTTLNTGRLTLPAACCGMMKRCLTIVTKWSSERVQWGQAIGKHAAIAGKVADLAADTYATESLVLYVSALVDRDKKADIRIEAAMAKLWGTEAAWHSVDQTMQIKGGRGYETESSLKNRGEDADPIERMMRDCRINTIFEGSSEIMKLFIAREALDPHLRRGAAAIDTRNTMRVRAKSGLKAGLHYLFWYPMRWLPTSKGIPAEMPSTLKNNLKTISKYSRKLSRALFISMIAQGPKLEKRQLLLGRYVDIATELFAMSVAVARAYSDGCTAKDMLTVEYICIRGEERVTTLFKECGTKADSSGYTLTQLLLKSAK
ncbi:MAG: alkylation response protein AidB-like acyl-CoA dehydrogenase [Rubritalea sp.]|jgi:alkylation response protein AidB-like acyl-CoA dehydrogenase